MLASSPPPPPSSSSWVPVLRVGSYVVKVGGAPHPPPLLRNVGGGAVART